MPSNLQIFQDTLTARATIVPQGGHTNLKETATDAAAQDNDPPRAQTTQEPAAPTRVNPHVAQTSEPPMGALLLVFH